jgi:hypothetical protein
MIWLVLYAGLCVAYVVYWYFVLCRAISFGDRKVQYLVVSLNAYYRNNVLEKKPYL